MLVPILVSVFWSGKLRAFSLGPMTLFQQPIFAAPPATVNVIKYNAKMSD
jgi:hypothetical protein